MTVRGPKLDEIEIWTDQRALRQYTHDNLRGYWQEQALALRQFPAETAKADNVAWFVLGASRLHHLLATNALTSKAGAGRYALGAFDERWRPIVDEAMSIRILGEPVAPYPGDRGRDVIDFADMVVRDGLAIPV